MLDEKILVVAGRGVKKKEDLDMLRELAELLGGTLASSRALVEKGWMLAKRTDRSFGEYGKSGLYDYMRGLRNGTVYGRNETY